MAVVRLTPEAFQAYADPEKTSAVDLLDAVDDALDVLEADPRDERARRRSFAKVMGHPC